MQCSPSNSTSSQSRGLLQASTPCQRYFAKDLDKQRRCALTEKSSSTNTAVVRVIAGAKVEPRLARGLQTDEGIVSGGSRLAFRLDLVHPLQETNESLGVDRESAPELDVLKRRVGHYEDLGMNPV